MSAFLVVLDLAAPAADRSMVDAMLAAAPTRGSDRVDVWQGAGVTMAVGRAEWELAPSIAGGAEVVVDGDVAVVADASIYHRDDLRRRLDAAGVRASGDTPSHLVAAAYRAWGAAAVERLEGDYAFVVWDGRARQLLAARDFVGKRTLYYFARGSLLVVGSTISSVLAHPACSDELNVTELAAVVSGLHATDRETVYRDVSGVPAGHALRFLGESSTLTVRQTWQPPAFLGEGEPAVPFERAAEELRELVIAATRERLGGGVTAITLSGGWDSPAVFAAAHELVRRGERDERLEMVSVRYAEGDSGYETPLIESALAHWGASTHWIDIESVDLFEDFAGRAARREYPFGHPFESWNRAIARTAVRAGARVVLGGMGGDHLFHAERAYIADLVRGGHLLRAAREWRETGGGDRGELFLWAIRPLLGPGAQRALRAALRRETLPDYLGTTSLAPWLRRNTPATRGLLERERASLPERRTRDVAGYEREWMLVNGFFARVLSVHSGVVFEEGVEHRSPLIDERIVRFAATRPRRERRAGRESKRLLRAAMRGLLPDSFLAPRPAKTGTMGDYLTRSLVRGFGPVSEPHFRTPALAELGVVETPALRAAAGGLERGAMGEHSAQLLNALNAELWLSSRSGQDRHKSVAISATVDV